MLTEDLLNWIVTSLDDGKGRGLKVIDIRGKTSIADFMVIVSGTSERHVRALADQVVESVKKHKVRPHTGTAYPFAEYVLPTSSSSVLKVSAA